MQTLNLTQFEKQLGSYSDGWRAVREDLFSILDEVVRETPEAGAFARRVAELLLWKAHEHVEHFKAEFEEFKAAKAGSSG
jgi:hypothetical protein